MRRKESSNKRHARQFRSRAAVASLGLATLCVPVAALAESQLEEVLVTARRTAENLQDVPVSAQAISGKKIQDLGIVNITEISKLAAGLTLTMSDSSTPTIILRGVRWTPGSGTPAVPVYLNENSFDPGQTFLSMYDIGQIEVLRGPQGTARGAPSISGAITMTTQRPDFEDIHGFVSGLLAGGRDHKSIQGGINVPLIDDKLAVRIAGIFDDGDADGVRSVNATQDPSREVQSARLSVTFQPIDELTIDAMYQRLEAEAYVYTQVEGSGSPGSAARPSGGYPFGSPAIQAYAANYNGPAIGSRDRRAVQEKPDYRHNLVDFFTLNASWDVLGHTLSYNFGSQDTSPDPSGIVFDPANLVVGFDENSTTATGDNTHYHSELRLSSMREDGRLFDYDVGAYYHKTDSDLTFKAMQLLPGALGNPYEGLSPIANLAAIERYKLYAPTSIQLATQNYSAYGNLVWHVSEKTEVTAGLRSITDTRPTRLAPTNESGFALAAPSAAFGGNCAFGGPGYTDSPIYQGYCDAIVPAANHRVDDFEKKQKAVIYNLSVSHYFTDDMLAYATTGSSWRAGLPAINNPGMPASLTFPKPEEATSYELGLKTTINEGLKVNAAIFQIDYADQLTQYQYQPYFNTTTGAPAETSTAFFYNVDAQVRGAELEVASNPINNLVLNTNLSYSKIEAKGGQAPCKDPSRPLSATNVINLCEVESGKTLNASPEFQASVNGNYLVPLATVDGYLRFNVSYQGENPNYGASNAKGKAYTVTDLYAGVKSKDGDWDVGLFAKNAFDRSAVLTRNDIITGSSVDAFFGPSGYERISTIQEREVGVSFQYNFAAK
ncbi:TonB-dependent receptor [Zhongshania sp.]|uniref:TonB-dependent receptor n=1 Tax=Zhongshania sp. TaxID=1971902 RepID=UPI003568A7EB